jgi:aminopeptidase N
VTQEPTEFRQLDTLVVSAPKEVKPAESYKLPRYNPSAERTFDLLHTKLDLRFDWEKEQVLGKATLRLTPYFYTTDRLVLEAKNFQFHQISLAGSGQPLKHDYDGKEVTIQLPSMYTRSDTIEVMIDYTATPRSEGGSAAIGSDKGLYFINPRGEDPEKPRQIWTQGETESNSRWFPTFDKPNERCTQETYLTVEDKYKTLSNGVLVNSTRHTDGTRTDYWRMDLPHAPYLFMISIGDYAVVRDNWRNKPVEYYVEPEFEADARAIFPHTPEMLSFFSDKLGVPYPWSKYSQVVVRDYVSGAMENTTAVIFGEFVQQKSEDLADDNTTNENIVAHEMFHHWFGDLVTCESWSNLTLNEGFANYSEYLWREYKHGTDEADLHWLNEFNGYMASAKNGIHDLIDFGYQNREAMFDAHSYNKGGLVLHMLRKTVGDEAFFAALNRFLTKNAFSDVEAHELRLAFEDVTGRDLNWFFDQWFFDKGQPELNIDYQYDPATQKATVNVEQTQNPEQMPAIFQLPAAIDIYLADGKPVRHNVMVNQRKQSFAFDAPSVPKLINFDAERMLLADKRDSRTKENYLFQYAHAPKFADRHEALEALTYIEGADVEATFEQALDDPFWALRLQAVRRVDATQDRIAAKLTALSTGDQKPQLRAEALTKLADSGNPAHLPLIKKALDTEKSVTVKGAALQALQMLDPQAALAYAAKIETTENLELLSAVAAIYVEAGDPKHLGFFEKTWPKMKNWSAIDFLGMYAALAAKCSLDDVTAVAKNLHAIGSNLKSPMFARFGATSGLNTLHIEMAKKMANPPEPGGEELYRQKDEELKQLIEDIKKTETSSQLKLFYSNFPSRGVRP